MEPKAVALRKILDVQRRELAIGYGQDRSIESPYPRRSDADLFDRPQCGSEAAEIPDPDRAVGDQRQAAYQVFKQLLRAEGDRQTADAQGGEAGGDVDAEGAQQRGNEEDGEKRFERTVEKADRGIGRELSASRHLPEDDFAGGIRPSPQQPSHGEPSDDLGEEQYAISCDDGDFEGLNGNPEQQQHNEDSGRSGGLFDKPR